MRSFFAGPALRAALLAMVALGTGIWRWDTATGYTGMMRFGERFADHRVPALRGLPIAESAGDGYDGQWYAQLAVDPRVTSPDVERALDKPSYRTRRIVTPLIAHVLGAGSAWRALQAYALLHIVAWLALGLLWWRVIPAGTLRANAAWCGVVLGTGALDSMRMTLTDLPAVVFLTVAAMAAEHGRAGWSAAWMLIAGFTRELSIAAAGVIRARSGLDHGARAQWLRTQLLRFAAVAPVIVWVLWLANRLPGPVGHEGNIDLPGVAFARSFVANVGHLARGDTDGQWIFGLVGGSGLAVQSIYVLHHWRRFLTDPWVSLGFGFACLFWVVGADPWFDYRAVARDCLPMTLAFNLLWFRSRSSAGWMLANISVLDGVLRLTWP